MMALAHQKKDPKDDPLIKKIVFEAHKRGLYDGGLFLLIGDADEKVKTPFTGLAGFIFGTLHDLVGIPVVRDYDIRMIIQISIPLLWKKARPADFICDSPEAEKLRILNLSQTGTDLDENCIVAPKILVREIVKYVEEHLTKTKVNKKLVSRIEDSWKDFYKVVTQASRSIREPDPDPESDLGFQNL
jgi:hypothetical protein